MFIRVFVLCAGLSGAVGAAQFPAFSQQYMQRLGGAVAALDAVVADFDASARAAGLSRAEAMDQLQGTAFLDRRQKDMARAFSRHAALRADLAALDGLGPFMRAYRSAHMTDREIAKGTWDAFEPSLPLTFATTVFAAVGFVLAACAGGVIARAVRPRGTRRALPA